MEFEQTLKKEITGQSHGMGSFVPAAVGEVSEFEQLQKKVTRKALIHDRVSSDVERGLEEEGIKLKQEPANPGRDKIFAESNVKGDEIMKEDIDPEAEVKTQ